MKTFFLLIIISYNSFADNFKISSFNESFSFVSKDVQTKGELEHFSAINPGLILHYNHFTSKNSRILLSYQVKQLNFGSSFSRNNLTLNHFQLGQGFFIEKIYMYYYLGISDRFLIFSENSTLNLELIQMPSIQIGLNKQLFELDGFIFGGGGNLTHYNSLNKKFNEITLRNGTSLGPNFNFTKFNKKSYYRVYFELVYESQPSSVSNNILYRNVFGLEYNLKF